MRIDAIQISDLSELKNEGPPATHVPVPTKPRPESQAAFVDPAIVSLGRRPASGTPTASGRAQSPAKAENVAPQTGLPGLLPAMFQAAAAQKNQTPGPDVASSMQTLSMDAPAPHELDDTNVAGAQLAQSQKKKKSRAKRSQHKSQQSIDIDPVQNSPSTATAQEGRGKGWRQTPILQSTASFQPFTSLKRNGKPKKLDNGWASEDVTEEMGEFDFENNLAKFDKRTIFDQMRKDDEIEDEDRLVSHNRRPRPLTGGGKNFHPTENVLDKTPTISENADYWNSEADVGVNGAEKASSREARSSQVPRRADSRQGVARRSQSRKASGIAGSAAGVVTGGLPLSRVNSNVRRNHSSTRSTPKPEHQRTNSIQPQATSTQDQQAGLYLLPSNRRVEAISTLQMLNLENIAANELGFTEDLMAENAGRGIAEVAVTALSDPALKVRFELAVARSVSDASVSNSTVVVLASNNKSSIRALAAARHLSNKGLQVVVCLVGIEREKDLLEDLRRQIQLYRNFGGKVLNKNDFFEHLRKGTPTGARISVSLIVDALLGLTISFEELRVGDQASVYELMEWANRNEAYALSVDIPTGIDPSTGKIAIIDGGQLFVKPRYVVSIGIPKRGLLEAVTPPADDEPGASNNPAQEDEWRLFIADLGLGSAVWRKAGTKLRRGVDFDGRWVLEMEYRGADGETEDEHD
jgi:enhancer of mRNA-decapping protein 3